MDIKSPYACWRYRRDTIAAGGDFFIVKAKNKGRMLLSVILLISLILSACSRADDMQNMQNTPQDTDTPYDPDLPDTIRLDENAGP